MAKGIYVGADVLWTEITNKTEYVANDGTRLTANGAFSNTQAYKACDGDASTYWSGGRELETWLKIEFPTAQKITKMNTYINSGDYPDSFSSVTIQGSNNDSTWTNLHTITSPQTELTEIVLNNATSYKYYRIYAVAINTSSARHVNVIEWQIPEYKGIVKSGKAHKVTKAYVGVSEDSLITNGDFSNGLNGWILYDSDNYLSASTSKGILTLTMTSRSNNTWRTMVSEKSFYLGNVGDLFYVSFEYSYNVDSVAADSYDDKCIIYIDNGSYDAFVSITNTSRAKTRYSNIFSSKDTNLHSFRFGMVGSANQYITISEIKLYNLTELYGAGNEPTQEWCDANLEALKNLYKSKANGIARKVKKGYTGVNGIAQLFYSAETLIPFTSNPVPTTWTLTGDIEDATATNEYGEWNITSKTADGTDMGGYSTTDSVTEAFDGSTSTYFRTFNVAASGTIVHFTLTLPGGMSINPKSIYIKYSYFGDTRKIQGYNTSTSTWEDIAELSTKSTTATEETLSITTDAYYSAFRVAAKVYSSSSSHVRLYEFQITEGTIKIE